MADTWGVEVLEKNCFKTSTSKVPEVITTITIFINFWLYSKGYYTKLEEYSISS